jgi:hypothetical protein
MPVIPQSFSMPMSSQAVGKANATGRSGGAFSTQIDETNRRIDGVLRHRNPTPETRAKIEGLRQAFNDRMAAARRESSDPAKLMQEYRSARGDLSDALTDLLGGPQAG